MKSLSIFTFTAAVMSISAVAYAHGSHVHEQDPVPSAKTITCEQLSASADLSDPAIKAMKARCDAAKKSGDAAEKKAEAASKK